MNDVQGAGEKSKRVTSGNGSMPDFGIWLGGNNRLLENWSRASTFMMKAAADLSQEIMTFSQNRLQSDMDAWKAVASCRSPGELFECQRELVEKATAQYHDEANKITSRMLALANDATAVFRSSATS